MSYKIIIAKPPTTQKVYAKSLSLLDQLSTCLIIVPQNEKEIIHKYVHNWNFGFEASAEPKNDPT